MSVLNAFFLQYNMLYQFLMNAVTGNVMKTGTGGTSFFIKYQHYYRRF